MYHFEETDYGFRVTVTGSYTVEDVEAVREKVAALANKRKSEFACLIDTRKQMSIAPEARTALADCEKFTHELGCVRFAIISAAPISINQLKQVGLNSGTASYERYIDAGKTDDWERIGLDWAVFGIEPPIEVLVGVRSLT